MKENPPGPPDISPSSHASGWRAFFSLLFVSLCVSGTVRPQPDDYESRMLFMQMVQSMAACSFGGLAAAFFAIKWRTLAEYGAKVWRLYLVFVGFAFLAGSLAGGNVAAGALGASLVAGIFVIPAGVALFHWRNLFTNSIFWVFCAIFILAFGKLVLS